MNTQGYIVDASGSLVRAAVPGAAIGEGVSLFGDGERVRGEIVALHSGRAVIATHAAVDGLRARDRVAIDRHALLLPLGTMLLGRALDAWGMPLDEGPPLRGLVRPIAVKPPLPGARKAVASPLCTGVRAIDGLLTLGCGAKIGLFGAPGCGKSTLLDNIVRNTRADAVVLGLIGERGREAQTWIGGVPPHTTIVCATSDRPVAERVRAAGVAMAQACALRRHGLDVLLVIDSLARMASALRELAVASGEPAGRGGYPVSVFTRLAAYLENAGCVTNGSITLVCTVLCDGDERDPLSEAARSLLDGHIELSHRRANAGKYPAIDVPSSTSRTMNAVASADHTENAAIVRRAISILQSSEDLRAAGIVPADPYAAKVAACEDLIDRFILQGERPESYPYTLALLCDLAQSLGA